MTRPEILVGHTREDEAWARDNGINRIWIFPKDEDATGQELSKVVITRLEDFQNRFNPALANDDLGPVKSYILKLLWHDCPVSLPFA